jgi:hypothetical protein
MRTLLPTLTIVGFAFSASAQDTCPTIKVSGPAGLIAHGMATIFSINADLPNFENLKYEWTVTAGKIDQGQGTPHLYLITNNADGGKELNVKVRVIGLPARCSDTAEFVYGELQFEGDPVSLDEWGRLSRKDELGRLDLAAAAWKQKPSRRLYFIVYLEQNETAASERARIKRISDHLTKTRRIPKEHVVILKGGKMGHRRTVVYFFPPGAYPPQP